MSLYNMNYLTLANCLTLYRLLLSPIFIVLYLFYVDFGIHIQVLPWILGLVIASAELSDVLDGVVARHYNQVSDLGKILDPMADSIYRSSAFLAFTQFPVALPIMIVFLMFFRDSMISTLRTICALKGRALGARASGKIKAVVQSIALMVITFLMLLYSNGWISLKSFQQVSFIVASCACAYTLFSGLEYLWAHRVFIKNMLQSRTSVKLQ